MDIDIYFGGFVGINAMITDISQPHGARLLFVPPPELESPAVLRQLTQSAQSLARMDAASQEDLPDPSILVNTIPLQEAQSNSAIQNIVTTQGELHHADVRDKRFDAPAPREALRYRIALREASAPLGKHGFSMDPRRTMCRTSLTKDLRRAKRSTCVAAQGRRPVRFENESSTGPAVS